MNLSGCSKKGVGVFSRTLSPEIGPRHLELGPPYLKVCPPGPKYSKIQTQQICNVIANSIAAIQYSKNSNLYK